MTEDSIGSRIKSLREASKMTCGELGGILGMSEASIRDIESGKMMNLKSDALRALCETFNVFPSLLLYDSDEDFWKRVMNLGSGGGDYLAMFLKNPMAPKVLNDEIGEKGIGILGDLTRLNQSGICRAKTLIDDLLKISEYNKET